MAIERKDAFKLGSQPVTMIGEELQPGQTAPEFIAHANDWSNFYGLDHTRGKVRIIASLPSLNTAVCDRETRRFNEEAANLGEDIVILVISTDLPYAQKAWCGAAGIDKVKTLSDHYDTNFGIKYGVLIKERRVLRRAVFVVDRSDRIVYAAYMPTQGDEPNYAEVITAAQKALD
jgi:thiol peroxidase